MWTEISRRQYERTGRRYASDATDAEWALIAPLLPGRKRLGRPRTTDLRDVFDAILIHGGDGVPIAAAAERFPAGVDGSALFL